MITHAFLLSTAIHAAASGFVLLVVLVLRRAPTRRQLATPLLAGVLGAIVSVATSMLPGSVLVPPDAVGRAVAGIVLALLAGALAGLATPFDRDEPKVLRGTRIRTALSPRRPVGQGQSLRLAGVEVPPQDECKHFKVIGTTGTGKTTIIRTLIKAALDRGDRAIIADPDGAYRKYFAGQSGGHVLLNPLDADSTLWDLFGELNGPADPDLLARALLPEHGSEDRAWRAYARVFVASLVRQLVLAGEPDVQTLHRLVAHADVDELRVLLDGTAASAYVSSDNARFLASVRAVASADLAVLEFIGRPGARPAQSIRGWVRSARRGEGPQVLYLPYRSAQLAALRGLIATWMRLASLESMEGPEPGPPLWFVVDELDALGAIDGLKDALARLRKYGGRCVLGLQSIAQLTGTYGAPVAQTIIENCGNTLLLRCSGGENGGTARFASMLIGEREVVRPQVSRSRPVGFGRGDRSRNDSEQRLVERAVLPAEIEQLPDLHGYLKLASSAAWHRVEVDRT